MAEVTALFANQLVMDATKCNIIFQVVRAYRTLLLATPRLFLAWLIFLWNVNLGGLDLLNVLVGQVLIDLTHVGSWCHISDIDWVSAILDYLLLIRRKGHHRARNSPCSHQAIVPSLERWVLIRIIAWRPDSHVIGGWILSLLRNLHLPVVLWLSLGVSSRRINFALNCTVSLSAAIVEVSILLVHLVWCWNSWWVGVDYWVIALGHLILPEAWVPWLLHRHVIWILWRRWHFQ